MKRRSVFSPSGYRYSARRPLLFYVRTVRIDVYKRQVYTDISRDGMLSGPNVEATRKLTEETGLDIIASGGVSCMEDLKCLHEAGIRGAIIGKALYENRIDLAEAVRLYEA